MDLPNAGQSDLDLDGAGDACDPAPADCESYCAGIGYAEVIAANASATSCEQLGGQLEEQSCATVCGYTAFQSWELPGGLHSCCCRTVQSLACGNCPGEDPACPQCPDEPG